MNREELYEEREQTEYISDLRAWNDAYEREHGTRRRAFVVTFGCQQNEADSEKLRGLALAFGYTLAECVEEADLILVNTCAIREHAEQKALSTIGQYKHLKAKNPALLIGVCGCMVTQEHRVDDIKFRYPYVDFVFGTSSIHRLPQILCARLEKSRRIYAPEEAESLVKEGLPIERESSYRAWVSIMYGCNNFCSYCIVPYVRGRERSRASDAVYEEVRELVDKGYKDITLLGQNVNSYGKELAENCDFAKLLKRLASIEGDYRLHFMTSHPKDATRELIDVMAENVHIANHFHLPLQSGSDRILKSMNRHYDRARYLDVVGYMREKMPDIAITTDIIVGFPGETEEDFEATLDMLRLVKFDMIYSFIYSPRKGTPAAEMEDQVPSDVQKARFERLLALQHEISLGKNLPFVNRTVQVLCDGVSKTNEALYSGRTEEGKIVFFEGEECDKGNFVKINIERAEAFALYGKKQKRG
ncbi:MAG: tRNA (N6-isopentenyl adenosine(37)-C2)-methylthiotransferase MiaB [Ruminococcaceae bacterium]|nr:tRNA (N6-isopentenyl adenosine(37)-C2)-methylthiotransferase MiaB [Oscillospiraceae bacterium]